MSWPNVEFFRPEEFRFPEKMEPQLIAMLDNARREAGLPFIIVSDHRPEDDGEHGEDPCPCVDFRLSAEPRRIRGRERYIVLEALRKAGFKRIGLYDLHFHAGKSPDRPDRVVWIGESQ